MSTVDRFRFDSYALDRHADEYCKEELRLTRELVDILRIAASCSPVEYAARTRRLMNDADRLTRYFSKMSEALIESGQLVEAYFRVVLEHLEDADENMKILQR